MARILEGSLTGDPCLLVDFWALRAISARESLLEVSVDMGEGLGGVRTLFGRSGLGRLSATLLKVSVLPALVRSFTSPRISANVSAILLLSSDQHQHIFAEPSGAATSSAIGDSDVFLSVILKARFFTVDTTQAALVSCTGTRLLDQTMSP